MIKFICMWNSSSKIKILPWNPLLPPIPQASLPSSFHLSSPTPCPYAPLTIPISFLSPPLHNYKSMTLPLFSTPKYLNLFFRVPLENRISALEFILLN